MTPCISLHEGSTTWAHTCRATSSSLITLLERTPLSLSSPLFSASVSFRSHGSGCRPGATVSNFWRARVCVRYLPCSIKERHQDRECQGARGVCTHNPRWGGPWGGSGAPEESTFRGRLQPRHHHAMTRHRPSQHSTRTKSERERAHKHARTHAHDNELSFLRQEKSNNLSKPTPPTKKKNTHTHTHTHIRIGQGPVSWG